MATHNVAPGGPGVGWVISGVQSFAHSTASAFERAGLNRIGDAVRFILVPNGGLGRGIVTSATGLTVTAVHNTSPLWMPVMMEVTMGRPAAWLAISLFGIPNAPAHVLIAAGVGSYILFTSSSNAIRWAFQKRPEQVGEILARLNSNAQSLRDLVETKESRLLKLNTIIEASEESLQSARDDLNEYSKGLNGKYSTDDPDTIENGIKGTEELIEGTTNYIALIREEQETVREELHQANEQLDNALRSLQEAQAEVDRLREGGHADQLDSAAQVNCSLPPSGEEGEESKEI